MELSAQLLVIGGAGYIGSHTVRALFEEQYDTLVFDNLSTGYKEFTPKEVPFVKAICAMSRTHERPFGNIQLMPSCILPPPALCRNH